MLRSSRKWGRTSFLAAALLVAGCRQDMHDQPRFKPFGKSDFYADQRSARPQVEGTVARGQLRSDEVFETGKLGSKMSEVFPFPITASILARGRDRYDIYCSPCHGRTGLGDGMIVRRGLRKPPSYDLERLRQAPPGYLFDVTSRGFGVMPDYATQVSPADRWAIVAYIKVLQRSQRATLADVPGRDRQQLEAPGKREQ